MSNQKRQSPKLNPLYMTSTILNTIDLRKKLTKPEITVDLVKEEFSTPEIDFSIISGCTAHKVKDTQLTFNQTVDLR